VSSELLTAAEVAARLGLSVSGVKKMIAEGRLPARKVGWCWVIDAADLESVTVRPVGRPKTKPP
jgi:excisionase family DNA binding protein